MYLAYDEYIEYGGTLEEAAYSQLEFEARSIIDWWTFNRLQNETEYPEAVKRCVFKLISLLETRGKAMIIEAVDANGNAVAGISSESNDGVSASYNTLSASEAVTKVNDEIDSTINMYLQGVRNSLGHKVLYRGIYPNE